MIMHDVDDVIGDYSGLACKVLDYCAIMKSTVDAAKDADFSIESWAPLAELIACKEFERVGNFKEVMGWDEYVLFLTNWARSSDWECSFKRVTQSGNLVFLELEERSSVGGHKSIVNSATIYEFDNAGKIRHLNVYLQMPLPDPAMLGGYTEFKTAD